MRPHSRPARPLALVLLLLGAGVLARAHRGAQAEAVPAVLVPFLVEEVRVLGVVDAQVMVANTGEAGTLRPERLRVAAGGATLMDLSLDAELPADPRYGRANELIERMPHSHRHGGRWFAEPDAPELEGDAALAAWSEIDALVDAMRVDYAAGRPEPFLHVNFPLATDQLFLPEDPAGTEVAVELRLDYRDAEGELASLRVTRTVRRLAPPLEPPSSLQAQGVAIHAGDLHVHSCRGEAVGACAPSTDCAAESFQTSGSFTYAQLKSQYQALGFDWFTATDHSYCINSDNEYAQIVAEAAGLTDASFLVIPDIELSSDEEGAQVGSDLGDLLCILGSTSANHMGAHGISSRKTGGGDGFLGFCDGLFNDVLDPFRPNAAEIRAEGGYPIINHPAADSFGWNSVEVTEGIEAGQMHGVEVWNGESQSGQGDDVGRWVDWLLDGRVLYAYSGSDTHDAAFDFGANHVLLGQGSFDIEGLEAALKAGRVFLSNGHQLVFEVEVQASGVTLPMGSLQAVLNPAAVGTLVLRAHYNFGADTSTITIFQGRAGDAAETVAGVSPPLTGEGVWEVTAPLTGSHAWFRAYSEGGAKTAYTNPVFFLPGGCAFSAYGAGLGGANLGVLSSADAPAAGSFCTLEVQGFSAGSTAAFYAVSPTPIPGGSPFLGGSLLIAPPYLFVGTGSLAGGAGSFAFQVPPDAGVGGTLHWQAAALDASQPAGFAFSNGLSMTVCALFE